MRHIVRLLSALILVLVVAVVTIWAALALWYRLPVPELAKGLAAGAFVLIGFLTNFAYFSRFRRSALIAFVLSVCVVIVWWSTIKPVTHADWAPDVARQVTGTVEGNVLTLENLRDFEWRRDDDFTEHWTTRSYDLSKLRTLDLFTSHWAGPDIAHVILSFGFDDGKYLAWSIEVRRSKGGAFSPVADFFKSNPLVIIAATERDVVGVRAVFRGEDVQLYRMKAPPEAAKKLLLEYVEDANALAKTPQFYNSITTNCTTTVVKMVRMVGDVLPFDWRLIVNGYLPDYAYERGSLDKRVSMPELRRRAHIAQKAREDGLSEKFSQAIRAGVPSPHAAQ